MKLIIRNLARSTTEEEVKVLFQEYGTVQSCDLVSDKTTGGSKGFAFGGNAETRRSQGSNEKLE